jgi:hypothetical protein
MDLMTLIVMHTTPSKRDATHKISICTKLFCWSIATEPLMYFVFTDPIATGSALTLSRLIQLIVVAFFGIFIIKKGIKIPNPMYKYYRVYFSYIAIGVFSTFLGITFFESYKLNNEVVINEAQWLGAQIWRGTYSRPIIELGISVYYFIYFVVAPRYMLTTKEDLKYLLDLIINLFKCSLFFGIFDIGFFLLTGNNLIARHIIDSSFIELGTRYHGFAGEPRDAFPYLVFGLTVYFLRSINYKLALPSKLIICLTCFALLLTQSASGLIGIIFALAIYIFIKVKFNFIRLAKLFLMMIIVIFIINVIIKNTERLMDYMLLADDLFDVLNSGETLHPILFGQSSNIFPLWQQLRYLSSFNILPVIFGFGIGSASFVNNNLGGWGELVNPQSNLVRLFYEVGLLGVAIYVSFQVKVVTYTMKSFKNINRHWFYFYSILLVGLCLSHRSTTIFILCGISLSIIANKKHVTR